MGIKLPHTLASAPNCNTEFEGLRQQSSMLAPKYVMPRKSSTIFSIEGYRENGKAVRTLFFACINLFLPTATISSQKAFLLFSRAHRALEGGPSEQMYNLGVVITPSGDEELPNAHCRKTSGLVMCLLVVRGLRERHLRW